jgi:type IV secretory pathway VirB2 component (pilin)
VGQFAKSSLDRNHSPSRGFVGAIPALLTSADVFAQAAGSPFETGANSLVTFAQTIGTPIAALVVIGLAIAAAVGKVSWSWVVGAIVGIAALFGAPTIVSWIRTMFGV